MEAIKLITGQDIIELSINLNRRVFSLQDGCRHMSS